MSGTGGLSMKIDAHHHFWIPTRGDYHWMTPDSPVLYREYLPKDLKPSLDKHRIERTVLVQAAQTRSETDFLLGLANALEFVGGVVGWLDMDSDAFGDQFERYRHIPKFIGLRPMLHDLEDEQWILRPRVIDSLKLLAQHDFPFEFLTYTEHLPHVLKALDQVQGIRAVLDHLSKPPIKARQMDPWKDLMSQVSKHPNVHCKLSGMVTEADWVNWKPDDLQPYVDHVVESFGVGRVIYGSDWPVCTQAATYDQVIGALRTMLEPSLDADGLAAVFGGNAERFYNLQ